MKKYIALVLVVFFISCQTKNEKTIEFVKVWYYNGLFESIMFYECDDIVYLPEKVDTLDVILEDGSYLPKESVVLESIITDEKVLQEIAIEETNISHLKYTLWGANIYPMLMFDLSNKFSMHANLNFLSLGFSQKKRNTYNRSQNFILQLMQIIYYRQLVLSINFNFLMK